MEEEERGLLLLEEVASVVLNRNGNWFVKKPFSLEQRNPQVRRER